MADSLAARRLVREHLETHFEEYLSSVASYLQQAYPEFQLSSEVSEEMAATVIVRVSHANPEPTNIEKALTDGADEVIRSRKPRLSQAKLLDEMNGPLRSESPRVLPSLRLIQTLSRAPANGDGEIRSPGSAPGRLLLANPPVDLGASIGLGGATTSEPEPAFGRGETNAELGRRGDSERRVGLSPEEARRLEEDEDEDLAPELAARRELILGETSGVEPKLRDAEDDPFDLDSRPTITRVVSDQAPAVDSSSGEPAAALVLGTPNLLVLRTLEDPSERFEVPSLRQEGVEKATATRHERQLEGRSPLHLDKQSSVPPTQESIIPGVSPEAQLGALGLDAGLAGTEKPRTRRKSTSRSKKPATKRRPTSKTVAAQPRKSAGRATKSANAKDTAKVKVKDPAKASNHPRDVGLQYVSDDLAVVAMMGFPTNPKRAAKLCVTAMAEDLGLDEHTDLSDYAAAVTGALEALRVAWTSQVPPDAHLEWQKVARQATLRAFLTTRT